jgi:hypothetical protein
MGTVGHVLAPLTGMVVSLSWTTARAVLHGETDTLSVRISALGPYPAGRVGSRVVFG